MADKYKKEINEILSKIDFSDYSDPASDNKSVSSDRDRDSGLSKGSLFGRVSSGKVLFIGLSLLLVSVLLRPSIPGLILPLGWIAFVLLILGYALFLLKPSQPYEKRWRGRVIESSPSFRDRLYRRLKWIRR